jgi:hypothetical protein
LNAVWARSPEEVYAVGRAGVVLLFDGTELRRLGEPPATVLRQPGHSSLEPRETPIELETVWASSPRDVWAAGSPAVLLHHDGVAWKDIDIGAEQVVVSTMTRLGRAVVTPRVGPVWGSGPHDVWVRKDVVKHVERPKAGPGRFAWSFHELDHVLLRFDGRRWRERSPRFPEETGESRGWGPAPIEVLALAPETVWTRFENALFLWSRAGWERVAPFPEGAKPWSHWSASGREMALIYNFADGFRELRGGEWAPLLASVPSRGAVREVVRTASGAIACRGWPESQVFFLRR